MSDREDNDDIPKLSTETLAALREFYAQQTEKDEKLKTVILNNENVDEITFEEDWQLSQFWYDDTTANVLTEEAIRAVGPTGKIALISCPTLFGKIKKIASKCQVTLFEYDQRFAVHGNDFILYDYRAPLDIPRNLAGFFDMVIADPPFLSEECLTKTSLTIKFLAKEKIILCTGAVMEVLAKRLLDVRKCKFQPHHHNNLGNEFHCYTNYDMDEHITF